MKGSEMNKNLSNLITKDCPCYNCICVPICRHKDYYKLGQECKLVMEYVKHMDGDHHRYRCKVIEVILKPTVWGVRDMPTEVGFASGKGYFIKEIMSGMHDISLK